MNTDSLRKVHCVLLQEENLPQPAAWVAAKSEGPHLRPFVHLAVMILSASLTLTILTP